jgi:capsular exopolysaccharide synthesis family protein
LGEISEALKRARDGARRDATPQAPVATSFRDALALSAAGAAPLRDEAAAIAIPDSSEAGWNARALLAAPQSEFAEAYRHFAVRVQRALKERGARSLMVTSAARGEGKTTTSCNLALALGSMASGRRIALLDLDLRRPAAARALGITPVVGIERVLAGEARIAEACIHTQLPELDLYLASAPARDALSLVSAASTGASIRELARQYEVLVIDSPPVLPVSDVALLSAHVDAVLLVARRGVSRCAAMREALESIEAQKALGLFLNESERPRHRRYYGYYGYEADDPKDRGKSE